MKNRYVGRTFIMPTQDERERAVRLKLNPIKSTVEGKSVTLIDDSIVRGTTSNQLVQLLYDAGATEVHMRIGAPPIVAPCYMGIDMASRDELIAGNQSVEEIRDEIEADSLVYLSIDSIAEALDKSRTTSVSAVSPASTPTTSTARRRTATWPPRSRDPIEPG